MVTVAAGDRLVLRTSAGGTLAVRALHATELVGPWQVRVLAPVGRVAAVTGVLELAGPAGGTVRLPARLAVADGALVLEAGCAGEPTGTLTALEGRQRRDDVRGEVHLPVRVAALDARAEEALRGVVAGGHTLDVSAGGARIGLSGPARPPAPGARLYLEVELPDGELAPAVVAVVATAPLTGGDLAVHVRFVDLAPLDRERFVRLVFEAERRLLAQRRGGPRPTT